MYGFYGRILKIDLTLKTFAIEPLSESVTAACLGGKGLATRLLLERNPAGVDPLAPENHLIFATGPFCRSRLWGGSRYGVYTKSPLTGFYAESYSGGRVPEAIDSAGFDAVVLVGKADHPMVVAVHGEGATFFDGSDLWGMDVYETEKEVISRFSSTTEGASKPGAVVIGPAGEKRIRFAIIANDKWRCAGRTGVGAVMGSKNLKGILFQGTEHRKLYDPESVSEYARNFSKTHKKNPGVEAYRAMGTTMMVALMNTAEAFPSRYWRQGTCNHWQQISGEVYHDKHDIKPRACAKCFMACGRMALIKEGPRKGLQIEGPEYETIYAFGGLCMVTDMAEIAYLNDLCDRLGLDTITAGNLCAFVMEAATQGRLDYKIEYGDVNGIATLIQDIAARNGIGEILAEGIISAARHWDLEDLAIHVKGMEPAGYDPRVLKGMGLTFATAPRGACHLRTTFYKPELSGMIPPDQIEDKAEMLIDFEDRLNIFDSLILCRFYRDLYSWEELEKTIYLTTGQKLSKDRLRKMAATIATMTRQFNVREGWQPQDDRLPKRLVTEALPSGKIITDEELTHMLKDYYHLRGWNSDGFP